MFAGPTALQAKSAACGEGLAFCGANESSTKRARPCNEQVTKFLFPLTSDDCPVVDSPEYVDMKPMREEYMAVVGSILWLAGMTRPDLAYAASQLARFLSRPGKSHVAAASRVLAYIAGTKSRKLAFSPDPALPLQVYVDSNWSSCLLHE